MSLYLDYFRKAFDEVNVKYHSSYAFHFSAEAFEIDPESMDLYMQYAERNFCYELYHQFKKIMEVDDTGLFDELQLNGEITKIGFNDTVIDQHVIIPDLVLHKSQGDIGVGNQKLFVEVKVTPEPDLTRDIFKLIFAVSGPLRFQEALLICVNSNFMDIQYVIRNHRGVQAAGEEVLKKIYVMHPDIKPYESFWEIK